MTLVEIAIAGPPVSQQTRRRERLAAYKEEVRTRAVAAYGERPPYSGWARVKITCVYDEIDMDVDNIAKPILDGLKGIVLADDAQVMDVLVAKRHLTWSRFVDPSALFLQMLATERAFVHVVVVTWVG
jgi:crossover junction endodeoxyribonuclease RusA